MKKYFFFGFAILSLFFSCSFSLFDEQGGELAFPEDIGVPIFDEINPYRPVDFDQVVDYCRPITVPKGFSSLHDIEVLEYTYPSITEFFGKGYFYALFEGLGLDPDDIFNRGNLRPRSVVSKFDLRVRDEGVLLRKNYNSVADVNVSYLDISAMAGSTNFLKLFFSILDGSEWIYPMAEVGLDGGAALSFFASVAEGSDPDAVVEKAAISLYADFRFEDTGLDILTFKRSDGSVYDVYFPSEGLLQFKAAGSLASSVLTFIDEDKTNIEGYPVLDGSEALVLNNYHCPYIFWINIKETAVFRAEDVFNQLVELLSSPGGLSGEALWKKVSSVIWRGKTPPYISLGVEFLDDGSGESRSIIMTDYSVLQFLNK